ncbi:hypothetical protein CTAM01_03870 [Colletotrichum tamarilloi]|uniref:Uncharacterized protein n=1 Tax=Colletotrichum tamarilloi TaxID=1209934 RepID=A0ABQ9RIR1_9PEZI|nr:uncharacterized protein CTAM01_03870 [Colletotrichum tamarilloi]KAK1504563.1 hypothetical protein CTAM01_03870 [Colletotrichum tamarilloi]
MLRTLATNTVIVNENDKGAQAQNGLGRAVLVRRGSVGREAGTAGREDASDLKTRAKHRPVGLVFCPQGPKTVTQTITTPEQVATSAKSSLGLYWAGATTARYCVMVWGVC